MRIAILDTVYAGFLDALYRDNPSLASRPYDEQRAFLNQAHFSTGDAYERALLAQGVDAVTLYVNAVPQQKAWAVEHRLPISNDRKTMLRETLLAQLTVYSPDVVYIQELSAIGDDVVAAIKSPNRLIVGQIACSLPPRRTFEHHDLMISSWPPIVEHFRRLGKPAEYLPLAFDDAVLNTLGDTPRHYEVTFVGGLAGVHRQRIELLERLCREVPIDVFGYGLESLPHDSPIRPRHRGLAWGLDAYRVMASSAITVNVHGDIVVPRHAPDGFANNQRLYEATGVGAMLLTDAKRNLAELFAPAHEVVAFNDADHCVELIRHYLTNEPQRRAIAAASQKRTLTEHTYSHRAAQLLDILANHLRRISRRLSEPRAQASGSVQ